MKSKNRFGLFVGIQILCFFFVSASLAVTVPQKPASYVVDLAGFIDDSTERKLNGLLQELEQKTTAQFIILTIDSLQGESIEEVSISIAHDKWKLGQKGKDNGLLLLISLKDRKYRIEVGYGLEGFLPDSFVGSVGRKYLVPYFKKGRYSQGVYAAAVVLCRKIAENEGVTLTGLPKTSKNIPGRRTGKSTGFLGSLFSLLFILGMFFLFARHPRLLLLLLLFSGLGGRRTWGGSGGFGGGGFGSFGGGGGGGFGGGGASGGW
ncbi:MAG: TPM domain-containing protein [Deltaproteobacteria bacterium]|nr:TPM domain-containing protein [Deltaproteobacteria bacterium]MBW2153584.1 TPM domain-containing protein [Deltaproteobacteria bacterium]